MQIFKMIIQVWKRITKPRAGWQITEGTTVEDAVSLIKEVPRGTETPTVFEPRLRLIRKLGTENSTIGDLYFDKIYQCKILEDTWRDPDGSGQLDASEKIYGVTCIPVGTYRVVWTFSHRFKRETPELLDVPHFSGIRIHSGNRPEDTLGCLITGTTHGEDVVWSSSQAYNLLVSKLKKAIKEGKVYISIENNFGKEFEA